MFSLTIVCNPKSPTVAIEMLLPSLENLPNEIKQIILNSTIDIRHMADRLLRQAGVGDEEFVSLMSTREPVHLKSFMEECVKNKNFERKVGQPPFVLLRMSDSFSNAVVSADPTELAAVLSNLINNAHEAYSETCANDASVHITCDLKDGQATVCVKDFGCGIPQEILSKIGQEEVIYGKPHGLGIGLLHACKYLKSWGGSLEIESNQEGHGTTVTLTFPNLVTSENSDETKSYL